MTTKILITMLNCLTHENRQLDVKKFFLPVVSHTSHITQLILTAARTIRVSHMRTELSCSQHFCILFCFPTTWGPTGLPGFSQDLTCPFRDRQRYNITATWFLNQTKWAWTVGLSIGFKWPTYFFFRNENKNHGIRSILVNNKLRFSFLLGPYFS